MPENLETIKQKLKGSASLGPAHGKYEIKETIYRDGKLERVQTTSYDWYYDGVHSLLRGTSDYPTKYGTTVKAESTDLRRDGFGYTYDLYKGGSKAEQASGTAFPKSTSVLHPLDFGRVIPHIPLDQCLESVAYYNGDRIVGQAVVDGDVVQVELSEARGYLLTRATSPILRGLKTDIEIIDWTKNELGHYAKSAKIVYEGNTSRIIKEYSFDGPYPGCSLAQSEFDIPKDTRLNFFKENVMKVYRGDGVWEMEGALGQIV